MDAYKDIIDNVLEGNENKIILIVNKFLDEGANANDILNNGLAKGMAIVGDKFKSGEYYLPDVLMAAATMQKGLSVLEPILKSSKDRKEKKIILGTVKDDIHDIGKNLVKIMLQGAGYTIIDIGVDVPTEKFVKCVKENDAEVLGISALLTTTMPRMQEIIEALEKEGVRKKVKIIIGGAPVTREYADEINADAFAPNAAVAVEEVKKLI